MAAATYIQEAANQVRNAIGALQDDIRTIQQESYNREAHLKSDANKAKTEARLTRVGEFASLSQEAHAQELALRAKTEQLEREAKKEEEEAQQLGQEAARQVQAKTGLINSLQSMQSQLERLASSAR